MKKLIVCLIYISVSIATEGISCMDDNSICDAASGLACASWTDYVYGPQMSCEYCYSGAVTILYDSYGDPTDYDCPVGTPQQREEE